MRKINPVGKVEYKGLKIEVYNKNHFNGFLQQVIEAIKSSAQQSNDVISVESNEHNLPSVADIVQLIQKMPNEMEHSYGDLIERLMGRKILSWGPERALYDKLLRLICEAHEILERAQNGKFERSQPILRENGRTRKISVFKFVKEGTPEKI